MSITERKDVILAKIARDRIAREEISADLQTILGRITALKTIWVLMPEEYRALIAKYTDKRPE